VVLCVGLPYVLEHMWFAFSMFLTFAWCNRCLEDRLQEAQKALAARDHELLAAREDLEHDETIFAARMRDLQGLQSQLQDLQVRSTQAMGPARSLC
jgi:hypothetical protein